MEYNAALLNTDEHILMNGDIPVLLFNLEELYIKVLNNSYLPYELKDYITDTDYSDIKKAMAHIETVKDYFSSRALNLSRENAKVILNVTALPQSLKTKERLKITFACKGLTMGDNFWIKSKGDDTVRFADVNLRKTPLSEASYEIAILGKHISATAEELRPDLSTHGMFPKYWHRENGEVYMWKTDKTTGNINTKAELQTSELLQTAGVKAVPYKSVYKDGILFAVSKCIATDEHALVSALSIRDWCIHTGKDFEEYIHTNWRTDFANMCMVDYIFANTDRHIDNWGFLVENSTNQIKEFAPLYDHNQSLVADEIGTDINELIYEPTGLTFSETVQKYAKYVTVQFCGIELPHKARIRAELVLSLKGNRN